MALELTLGPQRDAAAVSLDLATRDIEILGRQLGGDLAEGEVERFEPARVEIDLDFAHLTAVDFDRSHTVDLLDERLQVILDLPSRHVGRLARADRKHHDRQSGDIEPLNRRVLDVLWQRAANGGHLFTDFSRRRLRIDFEPQLDTNARDTSVDVEMTFLTPLMPATASSIGRVTSVSTSSGPAPG